MDLTPEIMREVTCTWAAASMTTEDKDKFADAWALKLVEGTEDSQSVQPSGA